MSEALQPTHDSQVHGLRSGEFGGHSSFAIKSIQLALSHAVLAASDTDRPYM